MATDMGNFQKTNIMWSITWKKRCIKREFAGIHDRFLRDHVFRERMIENSRDEDVCRAWDVLAEQVHTNRMSASEYFHNRQNFRISLNKSRSNTQPVRKRSDFNQALSTLNCLHREAGGQQLRPMPYREYKERHPSSSSPSTWWQWRESLVVFLRIHRKVNKEDAS